jgi:DNA-binding NtrC family response regulator
MTPEKGRTGVLILSVVPEAHVMLMQALRSRGIPVQVARSGRQAVRKLKNQPVLVLVDLVYGPGLDRDSIIQVNNSRGSSTLLGVHEGDLGRFAEELEDLVVDGFCRMGEWSPIVDLAAQSFDVLTTAARN